MVIYFRSGELHKTNFHPGDCRLLSNTCWTYDDWFQACNALLMDYIILSLTQQTFTECPHSVRHDPTPGECGD